MGGFQESLVVPGDLFLGAVGSEPKLFEMDETPPREFNGFSLGKCSGVFAQAHCGCASAHWSCVKLCADHEKRPGESCAHTNQQHSVTAALCSSLMDRHDGSSHLDPGLNRLGIPLLASILSAYAQSRSPHLQHGCVLLFRAVLQIQESESGE